MTQYLYVIIPCAIKILSNSYIATLKTLAPSVVDDDNLILGDGYLMINTCVRMSVLSYYDVDGINYLRSEMIAVAKFLNANEFWYVEELSTDEFDDDDFVFQDWVKKTHDDLGYCTMEYDKDEIADGRTASIIHDTIMKQVR